VSTIRASLLPPDSPAWRDVLDGVEHDFYHRPDYVELCARQEGATARAVLVERGRERMLLPILVRDDLDAVSPYGYPGPVGDPGFVADGLRAGLELLRSEGLIAAFVRLHPILNPDPPSEIGRLVQHGQTVSIDLSLPTEELWRQTRADHRNQINRALRNGHRAWFDEDWVHYAAFQRLYLATMARVGSSDFYRFDATYFDALRATLGPSIHLCVVDIDGAIAAAGLFVETSGLVEFHLSGTDDAFLRERPSKLLLHTARTWAKERGFHRLHLGGGLGGAEDSLFDFKAGFSHARHPFHTLRMVADAHRYAGEVQARRPGADPSDLGGFFPVYRASD
jgi:CelD/BcsL family acetyltransferase involved in cellulose biosynthesis